MIGIFEQCHDWTDARADAQDFGNAPMRLKREAERPLHHVMACAGCNGVFFIGGPDIFEAGIIGISCGKDPWASLVRAKDMCRQCEQQ